MRVRIYLSNVDIKDACKRRREFEGDIEVSPNDVQYISVDELIRLINANPEYIPIIKEFIERWNEEEKEVNINH